MSQANPNVADIPVTVEAMMNHTADGRQTRIRLKQWHEMVMDYILLNPSCTNQSIAEHFGYAETTVSQVINSDLFRMKFEERKRKFRESVDGTAVERLQGKLAGTAERILDAMDERIQRERETLGIDVMKESAEMVLKSLGYGLAKPAQHTTQTQVNITVSKSDLAEARERALSQHTPPALPAPDSEE